MRWWSSGPDELTVPVTFGEYTDEAWLSVENPADVRGCDVGVAPGGGDCDAHLVLGGVAGASMETRHSGYGTAG